jgi:RND family efflux transporter MFP subunit
LLVCGLIAVGIVAGGWYYLTRDYGVPSANGQEPESEVDQTPRPTTVTVQVVRPRKANVDRTTKWLPCEIHSFGWAPLYAEVNGYLKEQQLNGKPVDIGTLVKKGDVLARIDVPELEQQVKRHEAGVEQANARVSQMKARVTTAEAELDAAKAAVVQAEANSRSSEAWSRFRSKQLGRMEDLFALKSIDERLVDESRERYEASMETVRSSQAAIATSIAQRKAAEAKILQAGADVLEAKAQVKVAEAELKRAEVLVGFATITSPYNGIVTQRSLLPGGFVRSAAGGGNQPPLLTVEEIDKMRVVVQVPDRDVRYVDEGDGAVVEIDAFPGEKFQGAVSRKGGCEDPTTRLMRVEIDLPNPSGKILRGMFGRVNILLEKSVEVLTVPPSCIVSRTDDGKATVYVVRDGVARRVGVLLGEDNGVRVPVLRGLTATDQVIRRPPAEVVDGTRVAVNSPQR